MCKQVLLCNEPQSNWAGMSARANQSVSLGHEPFARACGSVKKPRACALQLIYLVSDFS